MKPLQGVTVVTLEHAIAAPYATRQLADLGARVIKIERPGVGDFARGYDTRVNGLSSHFVWTNRSKESLTLDLKQPEALEILWRLIAEEADVLVQNLAPGAFERMGFGFDEIAARNPRAIVCNISGYGPEGAYRDKKAYDLLIQSEAGFLSVTGTADTPSKAGISVADIAAGMYAYTNILAALIERGRTGSGQQIHVSMLEALAEWMGFPMYYSYEGAAPPIRAGASHATIYPYGPFRVGDGGVVMLGLQNEREWETFCVRVLQQPDLASDSRFDRNPKRHERREEVTQIIERAFASLRSDEVVARLEQAQIANARVNNMADLWAHPQLQARNRWMQVSTEHGPIPALIPPGLNPADQPIMNPVPALGQHTDAILEQLGYSQSARAAMRERGVI